MYGEQDDLWNGMGPEGQAAFGLTCAVVLLLALIGFVVWIIVQVAT